jgi:hypothetical protein
MAETSMNQTVLAALTNGLALLRDDRRSQD